MHRSRTHIAEELSACIRCNECLIACPALPSPIAIKTLNQETLDGPISTEVAKFAQACYQCGACVPVCPAGLHRDSMMLWIKMRLLRGAVGKVAMAADEDLSPTHEVPDIQDVYGTDDERSKALYATAKTMRYQHDTYLRPDGDHRRAAPWR